MGEGTISMSRPTVEIMGTRFVLIPEAELKAIEKASLPPLPPTLPNGNRDATLYADASIARSIVNKRHELGLTQVQLAKLAGIRQETLSRLESGKHKPNLRTVERIEAALKRERTRNPKRNRAKR